MICGFLFVSLQTHAQSYLGFRGGLNWATISIQSEGFDLSLERILGLNAAFFAEIGLSKEIAIQPEIQYLQKGWRQNFGFFVEEDNFIKFNYVEIPVLFKYRFGNLEGINGYAILGPSIGYALSGKIRDGFSSETEQLDFDEADGFSRSDFSLVFGAGGNFPAGPGSIVFDIRYNWGITSLFSEESDLGIEDGKVYNRALNFSLGYRFPIGGIDNE